MLKNVIFLLKNYKDNADLTAEEGSLVVTDDLELCHKLIKEGVAVLFVTDSEEFVPGVKYVTDSAEDLDAEYLEMVYCREKGLPMTILETPRMLVREMQVQDLDALYELYDDDEIRKYLEPLYEREQETAYIKEYIKNNYELCGFGMWLLFDKATGRLCGRAGINLREIDGETQPELGYVIGKAFRRKGYATEACRAILDYAKNTLGFEKLNIIVDKKNLPSVNTAYKLGAEKICEIGKDQILFVLF